MMEGDMGSMMAWMMGFGLIGWVIVIGLLIAILVALVRLLNPPSSGPAETQTHRPYDKPPLQ